MSHQPSDIADIGPCPGGTPESEPVDVLDLAFLTPTGPAVPKASQESLPTPRLLTRALVALFLLEIVVLGGIYMKKRYADSQVIFVPIPASERSVIT